MSVLSSLKPGGDNPSPVGGDGRRRFPRGPHPRSRIGRFFDDLLRRMVFRRLGELDRDRLVVVEGGVGRREFGTSPQPHLVAEIEVRDPRFYRHLAFGGHLGAAEAYIRGYWTCRDLVTLVRVFCRNFAVANDLERRLARLAAPLRRFGHWLRQNTVAGSRRNIAAHYDLSNDFFALFLDETLAYSCAIFPRPDGTLREASVAKFDRVCRKLELSRQDHVLEIGSGWGGFALFAARNYGCRVTATTISRQQYDFTRRRAEQAGLQDRVTVLEEDYRKLTGSYDKLVSIEMIEAVGHKYFDTYFKVCSELLKPDGMMLLQAITIPDQRYDSHRRSVDFIERYIFPGGLLPSVAVICRSISRATDFRLFHLEDLTPHYVLTLAAWRRRFWSNIEKIRGLGFPEELIRVWEFYFCYCEGGFRERMIGDVQMLLTKPDCRRASLVPPL